MGTLVCMEAGKEREQDAVSFRLTVPFTGPVVDLYHPVIQPPLRVLEQRQCRLYAPYLARAHWN